MYKFFCSKVSKSIKILRLHIVQKNKKEKKKDKESEINKKLKKKTTTKKKNYLMEI